MNRYSRHTVLPEIGKKGQKKLSEATVSVVGVGGLGSVIADALVRCGVGEIRIADDDIVEESNLQRQTLYSEDDIGSPKVEVALSKLKKINSNVDIKIQEDRIGPDNIEEFIEGSDIVLDGTDNLETRYTMNDACVKNNIPWIYTAVMGTYGMNMSIIPSETPCLRCIMPDKAEKDTYETGAEAGILFSIPRTMANIAATEAVKYLVDKKVREGLLTIDLWTDEYQITDIKRNDECICCGKRVFEFL